MEAVCSFGTQIFYQITQCHIPQNSAFYVFLFLDTCNKCIWSTCAGPFIAVYLKDVNEQQMY
jgi:hypothetical protein